MKNKKLNINKSSLTHVARALAAFFSIAIITSGVNTGISRITGREQAQVYAAGAQETRICIPDSMLALTEALNEYQEPADSINRIGTSFEHVMVGQRVHTIEGRTTKLDLSSSMEQKISELETKVYTLASDPKLMSDRDYENLLKIVEAEAGTEDIKGRVLVANVIMNRVNHPEFPNNIYDVIWETKGGVAQFSPIIDGAIYRVTVSDDTREAVRQAINGTDYSEGALFFVQRDAAAAKNVSWFDQNLERLFKHGCHEFYKYPDKAN